MRSTPRRAVEDPWGGATVPAWPVAGGSGSRRSPLALALALAACGGGGDDPSGTATAVAEPTATAASETAASSPSPTPLPATATATATPSPSPTPLIPGGRIRELTWREPVEIDGFAVIIGVGCFGCDVPLERVVRIYRNPAGELRQDVLFEQTPYGGGPRYISGVAIARGGATVAVTVCASGYCGGVAYASPDATSELHVSPDGGITYSLAELAGAKAAQGYGAEGLLLWNQDSRGVFTYEWHAAGQPLAAPSSAARFPTVAADAATEFWATAERTQVVLTDGTVVWEVPVDGGEIQRLLPRPDGGVLLIFWRLGDADFVTRSMGGQDINHVRIRGGLLVPRSWHDQDTITANFWAGESTPVLFRPGSGSIRPLEGPFASFTSDAEPDLLLGRNWWLASIPGPFARVASGEECLNVRAAPALIAEVRGCWADGVLFRTEGRTEFLDGREWVEVTPPSGEPGWAAAEFLEYLPAPEEPPKYGVTVYPADVQTGIPAVDRVLDALRSRDSQQLADVIDYLLIGCVAEQMGIGSRPLCAEGEAIGTLIRVFPGSQCEGFYRSPEGAIRHIIGLAVRAPRVYALSRTGSSSDDWPSGDYALAMTLSSGFGVTLFVGDEGIIRTSGSCGALAPGQADDAEYILPPLD